MSVCLDMDDWLNMCWSWEENGVWRGAGWPFLVATPFGEVCAHKLSFLLLCILNAKLLARDHLLYSRKTRIVVCKNLPRGKWDKKGSSEIKNQSN